MRSPLRTMLFFLCLSPLSSLLMGQTVDTVIRGTVKDSTGAILSGATVTSVQTSTGVSHTIRTGNDGNYEIRYLIPGEYTVEVRADGFVSQRRVGLSIQIDQQTRIDFALQIGAVQQTVEVQSTLPLLTTESATLGGVVGAESITNLPLNGRKFDDLAVLTPGVTVYNPDIHSSSTDGSTISANGGRSNLGQINVDGITMVNNRHNYVNIYPSVDAIQEFKVQTGDYSAEYGGNAGANVNIQIKSGTNRFHGSAFEFFRNNALDARDYFRPSPLPKNVLKQNQYGATLGGPILRERTFFFASYEGLRSIQEFPQTANVLTPAQRQGDFSSSSTPIIDPLTGAQFPGNIIPKKRLDSVSVNLINQYMPLPNSSGDTNYAGASSGNLTVNQEIVRMDHTFNAKNQVFVHYIRADRDFPNTDVNPSFKFKGSYPANNFMAQYVHTFSPSLINEVRGGFDLENVQQLSTRTGTGFTIESLGINGFKVGGPNGRALRSDEEGFPLIGISGYIGIGDDLAASNLDKSSTYQVVDNLTWIRGQHTFKVGADVRKLFDDATTNNTPFGQMNFTGDITGDPAADFMLGYPRTSTTPEGVPITKARQWRSAYYFQDDWKVLPTLTLNLGLRYDWFNVPLDVNDVTRTLDFSTNPPHFIPTPGQEFHDLWKRSKNDIGPRVGFAYNFLPSMVVRGGYGVFFFGGQFDNINILQLNPPTAGSLTISNPSTNPLATIENPVPAALYPTNPYFNAVTLTANRTHPDLYLQNWNLQVSKQFGPSVLEIGYVGTKGTHLDTSFKNYNQPDPGLGDIQPRRPYSTFARIRMQAFGGNSNYHSLQARYEYRASHRLNLVTAYTWSHEIDDAANETNGGGCGCQNPRKPYERASGLTDQRHNLDIGYVWQIYPGTSKSGLLNNTVRGWSFEGLISLSSGNPFDVLESSDTQNDDGLWERPNLVPGQKLSVAHQGTNQWFNVNAFTPSILVYGNSPRNPFVGPGNDVLNLTLMKEFSMKWNEHHVVEFRAEAFNAFNTAQFSAPDSSLGDGTFGQITSTKSNNRQLQFALKYRF